MKNKKISVGILGASGKMGQLISQLLSTEFSSQANLDIQITHAHPIDLLFKEDTQLSSLDVIIDVSHPSAMSSLAHMILEKQNQSLKLPAIVIGSTGWNSEQTHLLHALSEKTPVLIAPNFSAGIFILSKILQQNSSLLRQLGYTPVLVETHHRHKKDAPSGTALSLQRSICSDRPQEIQTHSIRAGEVVGTHDVTFYGQNDSITLKHFAQDRKIFARGAIEAALWLTHQKYPSGLIQMSQYFESLNLENSKEQLK